MNISNDQLYQREREEYNESLKTVEEIDEFAYLRWKKFIASVV